MPWFQWQGESLLIHARVQARAKREGIDGLYGERLRIRVTAPPVDNKANLAIAALLASEFALSQDEVRCIHGEKHQNKTFSLRKPDRLPDWFIQLGGSAAQNSSAIR